MKKFISLVTAAVITTGLIFSVQPADAGIFSSASEKRQRVDLSARHTMERLLTGDPKAQRLYDRAYGYAVFNVTKGALIITGGGGTGVAIHKMTDDRTYMHMGMGGLGLGIGGQAFRVVLLFEDELTFVDFVSNGWHASSSANAVAGRTGANAEASFTNGVAIYQLTDAGLMLQADIGGTRYWRSKRLNDGPTEESVRTAATEPVQPEYSTQDYSSTSQVQYDYETQTTVYPLETEFQDVTEYRPQ
ncbi:MAG: hypothetical protein OER80_06905 [Gammaproteobacteria bacterium]|nr:hypothetical protein [Gammaproteobacteria bacterium]MDH3769081.1 hypothetical protein [Gammaproteobacteria bacterium]